MIISAEESSGAEDSLPQPANKKTITNTETNCIIFLLILRLPDTNPGFLKNDKRIIAFSSFLYNKVIINLTLLRFRAILSLIYRKGGLRVSICIRCARTRFIGQ